jgi:hypothetical protein
VSTTQESISDLPFNAPLPNDIYEMELIGDSRFSAAVPVCADAELKKRILGAIKSYYGNVKSIDYTIKRYGTRWEFADASEKQQFVVNVLKCIDKKVSALLNMIMDGRPRPDIAGLLAAEVALLRLKSSFRSALILISQAHAFEAAAITRLALEQIAWAYAVHACRDQQEIRRVRPTKSISDLKRLAPLAGPLYGALSTQAHVEPEKAGIYYTEDPDGSVEIRHQLSDESYIVLGYLLGVLGLFRHVILQVLGDYVDEPAEKRFLDRFPTLPERLCQALSRLKSSHRPLDLLPDSIFEQPRNG